jgi:uncharacterized protein (DUF433 family)
LPKLGAGMLAEAIPADQPQLAVEDIHAAQAFAADYLATKISSTDEAYAGSPTCAARRCPTT